MWTVLLAGAFTLAAPRGVPADTTFSVPADARIEIENLDGSVEVRAWDRDAVRFAADPSDRGRIRIRHSGSLVRIEATRRYGNRRDGDYVLTVPLAATLRIVGPFADVRVDGVQGAITVETVRGDIAVRGGNGLVELHSVEGDVTLDGARGRVVLGTVNEGIRASNIEGELLAESVNGDVELLGIASGDVVASSVNGDIDYRGEIRDDGRYGLTTHNGDVTVRIPETADATVTISTFNGEIDSTLPIMVTEIRRNRRLTFTLGRGTARVDLESFNGTIRLRRPADRSTED